MGGAATRPDSAVVTGCPVLDEAFAAPWRFGFFQLVRLLDAAAPEHARLGTRPADEALRLRAHPGLHFPAADVAALERREAPGAGGVDAGAPEGASRGPARNLVTTTFLGLFGSASPLPTHHAELFARDEHATARAFVDLFHHRLLSLLYAAWARCRVEVGYERDGERDANTRRYFAMLGIDPAAEDPVPGLIPDAVRRHSWVFAGGEVTQAGMQRVLEDVLQASVRIDVCVPRIAGIPDEDRLRLGDRRVRLGRGALLGERLLDRTTTFRIVMGPVPHARLLALLPGGADRLLVARIVEGLVGMRLRADLQVRVDPGTVPAWTLGTTGDRRLGWNIWLGDAFEDELLATMQPIDTEIAPCAS
jgi:type VI secretion system protein ImpH